METVWNQRRELARSYVRGLRRTGQYRKSYWYGVVFGHKGIAGHIPAVKRSWIERDLERIDPYTYRDGNGQHIVIVSGQEAY